MNENTKTLAILGVLGLGLVLLSSQPKPVKRKPRIIKPERIKSGNPAGEPSNTSNPDRYKAFHGAEGNKVMVKLPMPDKDDHLVKIGDLERIEYKPTGSSKRKNVRFFHNAGETLNGRLKDRASLAAINKTGHLVIIPTKSGHPKFTANGIIG